MGMGSLSPHLRHPKAQQSKEQSERTETVRQKWRHRGAGWRERERKREGEGGGKGGGEEGEGGRYDKCSLSPGLHLPVSILTA